MTCADLTALITATAALVQTITGLIAQLRRRP